METHPNLEQAQAASSVDSSQNHNASQAKDNNLIEAQDEESHHTDDEELAAAIALSLQPNNNEGQQNDESRQQSKPQDAYEGRWRNNGAEDEPASLDERNDIAAAIAASLASKEEGQQRHSVTKAEEREQKNRYYAGLGRFALSVVNSWTTATKGEDRHQEQPISSSRITVGHQIYQEVPLQNPYEETRFLRLRMNDDGHILSALCFHERPEDVDYQALSYRWDTTDMQSEMEISGLKFNVATGLFKALNQICANLRGKSTIDMWVDAICINQKMVTERNAQVSIMNRIYSLASSVVIWIGESNDDTDETLRMIKTLATTNVMEPRNHVFRDFENLFSRHNFSNSNLTNGCIDLLKRPYWERTWTIQELTLPKSEPVVMCGTYSVSLDSFAATLKSLAHHLFFPFRRWNSVMLNDRAPENLKSLHGIFQGHSLFKVVSMLRRGYREFFGHDIEGFRAYNTGYTLRTALMLTRESQCSDSRDKIYGILGISDTDTRKGITVNYLKSSKEVFIEAVTFLIFENVGFGILSRSPGVYYRDKVEEDPQFQSWPTWLPIFNETPKFRISNPYLITESHPRAAVYKASRDLPPYHILVANPQKPILTLFGIAIGKVTEVVNSVPSELAHGAKTKMDSILSCFLNAGTWDWNYPVYGYPDQDNRPLDPQFSFMGKMYDPDPNKGDLDLRGPRCFALVAERPDTTYPTACQCMKCVWKFDRAQLPDNWADPPCAISACFPEFEQLLWAMTLGRIGANNDHGFSRLRQQQGPLGRPILWPYSQRQNLQSAVWRTIIGDHFEPSGLTSSHAPAPSWVGQAVQKYMIMRCRSDKVDRQTSETPRAESMPYLSEEAIEKMVKRKRKVDAVLEGQELGFIKRRNTEDRINGLTFEQFAKTLKKSDFDEMEAWLNPTDPQTEDWVGLKQPLQDNFIYDQISTSYKFNRVALNATEDADMAQALQNSLRSAEKDARRRAKGKAKADDEFPSENEVVESESLNLSIDTEAHVVAMKASLKTKLEEDRRRGNVGSSKDQEKGIGLDPAEITTAGMISHDKRRKGGDKQAHTAVEGENEATAGASVGSEACTKTTTEPQSPPFRPDMTSGTGFPAREVDEVHLRITDGRNAFRTDTGFIGFGPLTTKTGDIVVVVAGGDVPLVLRPHLNHFLLVGQSYVHGVMFGELFENCAAFNKGSTSRIPLQPFEIR
ncbi:heterokaryon incompatibility protein-domain-containing protein [Xylariaceae sp. FL1651]|nr:heterokaryon incompatibility protein-domain-containing protein [Xylariaceae sp. FL1651]